jgi:flagellar hook-associated protein 2
MAGITSGIGLVTGINIEDTVNKLIAVQAQPRDNLTARKKDIEARQTAVADLTALTLGVQFAARRLKAADLFTQKSVTSSNTSALTATASSTAVPGQYQFVPVRLATTQHLLAGGVSTKDQPLGAGTFSFRFGGFANESINLDEINGGDGLARGKIKITDRSGASATIDLRYAVTVDDVLAAINQNESVEVQASVAGDRLVLTDN